jgi:hypothetical protein
MAQRNIWMDIYSVGYSNVSISTVANASFGIPLLNHPNFEAGTQTINQRKATGTSYRQGQTGMEYQQGSAVPTTSYEFDVNYANLSHILWAFFQSSAFQGTGAPYVKYFIPYESPTSEVWLTLVRKLAASGTGSSHQIAGAQPKTLALSCEEGQPLKATVEFQGYSFVDTRDVASDTLTFSAVAPLLWQNATITLAGSAINVPGFNLTVNNNLVTKFHDNATAVRHLLGDLTVEGTIRVPWSDTNRGGNTELDAFINGTVSRLVISWGSGVTNGIATTTGDFSIVSHIRRTSSAIVGDDELMTEINFEGVCEESTSSFSTASASSVAIAGSTAITGTNTTLNNLDPGDLFYGVGLSAAGDKTVRVLVTIPGATSATAFPAFSGTEGSKLYHAKSTPITITIADNQNISGM